MFFGGFLVAKLGKAPRALDGEPNNLSALSEVGDAAGSQRPLNLGTCPNFSLSNAFRADAQAFSNFR